MRRLTEKDAEYIAEHQEMYPKAMYISDAKVWKTWLNEGTSWGIERAGHLAAWIVCTTHCDNIVYIDDLAVLPDYQKQGLGRKLYDHVLKATPKRIVTAHCRYESYPMVSKPMAGWELIHDEYIVDFYLDGYGIHEDAHFVILREKNES